MATPHPEKNLLKESPPRSVGESLLNKSGPPGQPLSDKYHVIHVRKELNILGRIVFIGMYTSLCLLLGSVWLGKGKGDQETRLISSEEKEAEIVEHLGGLIKNKVTMGEGVAVNRVIEANERGLHEVKKELIEVFDKRLEDYKKQLAQKDKEIYQLKTILDQEEIKRDKVGDGGGGATIPFNQTNLALLRYDQQQEAKKLKKLIELKKNYYLSQFDMSRVADQKKWAEIETNLNRQVYEQELKHQEERSEFQKNGYRVPGQ